ncbi:hypothetical protein AB0E67_27300 [Streptomyces sp. NPDC032161]|uniref:hypothetical protein n=1 Tax=unclassified Streptomyces TaxID=2593676 RepID=UPI0033CE6CC7
MTTTPADELRAAAELLRAAALAAAEHSGSTTWYSKRHFPNQDSDFTVLTAGPGRPLHCGGGGGRGPAPYMHAPVSEYIAAVGPGVGLAIADWLGSWTGVDLSEHGPAPEDAQHALAVARKILGTTPAATIPCSLATLRRVHAPHGWEPQPGMAPVHCPGHPSGAEQSDTGKQGPKGLKTVTEPAVVSPTAVLLATPCAACEHTLNWHTGYAACTVRSCGCGRFQPPADEPAPAVTEGPGR